MIRRIVVILSALFLAIGILASSILRATSLAYHAPSHPSYTLAAETESQPSIDYSLASPGRILPDNPLWFFKALKDKFDIFLATDATRRAELKLLLADKRLAGSKILFEKGKSAVALSTLTKGEKYLEEASKESTSSSFLETISKASLKHREVIEAILATSPEEIRPKLTQVEDYSKVVYKKTSESLISQGMQVTKSPFDRN